MPTISSILSLEGSSIDALAVNTVPRSTCTSKSESPTQPCNYTNSTAAGNTATTASVTTGKSLIYIMCTSTLIGTVLLCASLKFHFRHIVSTGFRIQTCNESVFICIFFFIITFPLHILVLCICTF